MYEAEDRSESPNFLGESPNPLLIHTVIKELTHYLTTPDLKVCRLVCKQWDEELSKILRKVSYLPLLTNRRLENFLQSSIMNHTFCSTYQLGIDITTNNLRQEGSHIWTFFHLYGPFIKSLYLDNCPLTRDDLVTILYDYCPNLEEFCLLLIGNGVEEGLFLNVSDNSEEKKSEQERSLQSKTNSLRLLKNIKCLRVNLTCTRMIRNTKLTSDLLKITPNVETISWIETYLDEVRYDRNFQLDLERAWCAKPTENGVTIRDTIMDTAIWNKELQLSKLSRIESNMRLNNESIQVLEKRRFPLKYLDISLTIDVEPKILSSLLTSLSKSLVTLRLEFYPTHGSFYHFIFPKLLNLESLFLQKFPANFSFYKNFNSTKFPSLKSLTFCETDFKGMLENDDEIMQQPESSSNNNYNNFFKLKNETVRILQVTCDLSKFPLSNDQINGLAKFLPNLREARVDNFDRMDKFIWETSFSKLKFFGSPKGENECSKCCKHFVKGLYQHQQR